MKDHTILTTISKPCLMLVTRDSHDFQKCLLCFDMKTFDLEDGMPRLPVPELKDTINKYLESIKPLTTKEGRNEIFD